MDDAQVKWDAVIPTSPQGTFRYAGRMEASEGLLQILMELAPASVLREAVPPFQQAIAFAEHKMAGSEPDALLVANFRRRAHELLHHLALGGKAQ